MAKKQENRLEAARDAATGYAAVVLGIVCFILLLVLIMAAVRFIVGLGSSSGTSATSIPAATTSYTASPIPQAARASLPALPEVTPHEAPASQRMP